MKAADNSTAGESNLSETDNLTQDGLMSRLMQGNEPEASELPESEEEEEAQEDIEEVEDFDPETDDVTDEVESAEDEEETEDESEIDLTALSPEEIQDLAKRGKSRLLDRVGKLTAEKRALEAKLEEVAAANPVKREIPQDENPFKNLQSHDEIKEKWEQVEQTLEQTDALLDDYEDYGPDDVITVGNQEFTKKQLRQANRNARDAMNKYLPAQSAYLKKQETFKQATEHWNQEAEKTLPEIKDEKSEIAQQYQQLVNSPGVQKLREVAPEYAVDVGFLMAHALRSIHGQAKPKVSQGAGTKLKVKPPASPVSAGAARRSAKSDSKERDLMAKANERGGMSQDDLATFLLQRNQ